MQFAVPQFIEVEAKVIGPISVRQFIILLVTAGVMFVLYELLSLAVFILPGLLTLGVGLIFSFVKINSQPFHTFILSIVQTFKRPRLSVWNHQGIAPEVVTKRRKKNKHDRTAPPQVKGDMTDSRLAELSLIVDSGGKYSPSNPITPDEYGSPSASTNQKS